MPSRSNFITAHPKLAHWTPLVGVAVVAIFYRLWQWRELPPGLSSAEASGGLIASAVAHGTQAIGLHAATGFSPLWETLAASAIVLFGSTAHSLRLMAVLLSLIGIVTTYGWVHSWYDRRTAGVAALLLAVMPWSVTMSRNASPTILGVVALTTLLWALAGFALMPANKLRIAALTAAVVLCMASGPLGWIAVTITIIAGGLQRKATWRSIKAFMQRPLVPAILTVIGVGSIAATVYAAAQQSRAFASAFSLAAIGHWPANICAVIGMFFYRGDANFYHNLGGEPMLNAFVALTFVAGIMLLASRFQRARDRALLLLLGLSLVPAVVSQGAVPNAARAALALPLICAISAIGIFYLLDLWSATFPVNSAARSMGQSAISLLLLLTAYQGYTQYFTAWANSSETYAAYNRSAVAASDYVKTLPQSSGTILVCAPDEIPVAQYLSQSKHYTVISPDVLATLPTNQPYRLILTATTHDQVVGLIAKRLAGGTIKPHLDHDGSELFYDYIKTK